MFQFWASLNQQKAHSEGRFEDLLLFQVLFLGLQVMIASNHIPAFGMFPPLGAALERLMTLFYMVFWWFSYPKTKPWWTGFRPKDHHATMSKNKETNFCHRSLGYFLDHDLNIFLFNMCFWRGPKIWPWQTQWLPQQPCWTREQIDPSTCGSCWGIFLSYFATPENWDSPQACSGSGSAFSHLSGTCGA